MNQNNAEPVPAEVGGNGTSPLSGLTVLDLSSMMAGPYCGRWLSDLGARVIKIESPEGDYMRNRPPLRNGTSAYYGVLNSGKRSVVLDLKTAEGKAVLVALAAEADVLLEGFRPGVTQRLGIDYISLSASCPRLVYCSISGYGQSGPRAGLPAYAPTIHAESGYDKALLAVQDTQDQPARSPIPVADTVAALFAAMAIQAALLQRERTGIGQHIDVSLLESMLTLMPYELVQAQFQSTVPRAVFQPVAAQDGFIMVAPLTQKNFLDLCTAIGRPDIATNPDYNTPLARVRHWNQLHAQLSAWSATRNTDACIAALRGSGVPCAAYGSIEDAFDNDQLLHRGFFGSAQDAGGDFKIHALPFQMSGASTRPGMHVAALGEDTAEVLAALRP